MFGLRLHELAAVVAEDKIPEPVTASERAYRAKLERDLAPELLAFARALAGVADEAERERLAGVASRFLALLMSEHVTEGERNAETSLMEMLAQRESERLTRSGIKPN